MKTICLCLLFSIAGYSQPAGMRVPSGTRWPIPTSLSGFSCTPASGYSHCRSLTVAHGQVGGSTLTNFPASVAALLGASRLQNSNGYDHIYTSDSAGATLIPWEQELAVQSTGGIIDWVLLASISASADTTFYVSYDNASISTAQNTGANGPTHVWDSSYAGVWHLPNGTSLSGADSTSNANTGTLVNTPTATVGTIDGAASLNGTNQEIDSANSFSTNGVPVSSYTISAWINSTTAISGGSFASPFGFSSTSAGGIIGVFQWDHSSSAFQQSCVQQTSGGTYVSVKLGTALTNNTWYYLTCTWDGTTLTGYLNGTSSSSASAGAIYGDVALMSIGNAINTSQFWPGKADEVRLQLNSARAANVITVEYNNQVSGSTLISVGSEH